MDGRDTAFDRAWEGWFKFKHGHSLGSPPPPKLYQAVLLLEREIKSKEALEMKASEDKRKKEAFASRHKNKALVITGGKKGP